MIGRMPFPLQPPIAPMLAKLQEEMPVGGGWLYEPKWDGFRTIVFRDGADMQIQSRDKKPLDRYFPELRPVLFDYLPARCVMDGEVIVSGKDGLDFDYCSCASTRRSRASPCSRRKSRRASWLSTCSPLAMRNLTKTPLIERRRRLEAVLPGVGTATADFLDNHRRVPLPTSVLLTPQTADEDEARRWFEAYEGLRLEGLVVKRRDQPYIPGKREMVKVKHRRSVDCVVGGYRVHTTGEGIGALLLGLYRDGVLQYVGHTSSFSVQERKDLLETLKPLEGRDGFGMGRTPGGISRWSSGRESEWVSRQADAGVRGELRLPSR